MKLIRVKGARGDAQLRALEQRGSVALDSVAKDVTRMLRAVRERGDRALLGYAKQFDGLGSSELRVTADEMEAAWQSIDASLKQAMKTAAAQIRRFAEKQMPREWDARPVAGLITGQRVRPLGAVGCYVPGGRYPLPSTMLMTAVPAQVAGVKRIVVVSPKPRVETLAAAHLLGVTEFYRMGGAHAVGALAYGTESIARVDKIVGPGNLYVTAAKRAVAFDCAIDMLAGPTEIVVTSEHGDARMIAADIVAQAEHDPEAFSVLVTTQQTLAADVTAEVKRQSAKNVIAKQSLRKNGYVLLAQTVDEARAITNRLAPEHLTVDDAADLAWVENAGSVFVGSLSAQSLGDYISGPNHTLPTGGQPRVRGGLSVNDFVKLITVQEYDDAALAKLGPHAVRLAEAEGLTAHAESVRVRLQEVSRG